MSLIQRAVVSLKVSQIRVLGVLLLLIRLMDQEIESICRGIALDDSKELLFMQPHQFLNSRGEQLKMPPA
jgi:hypothetical protein